LGQVEVMEDDFSDTVWHSQAGTLYVTPTDASIGKSLYVSLEGGPSSWNGTSAQRLGVDNIIIKKAVLCDMADISLDANIDIADLAVFYEAWLDTSPEENVDLWPDGIVDMKELLIFSTCWGQ
jgi:hypothetical protein